MASLTSNAWRRQRLVAILEAPLGNKRQLEVRSSVFGYQNERLLSSSFRAGVNVWLWVFLPVALNLHPYDLRF